MLGATRLLAAACAVLMIFGLTGCSGSAQNNSSADSSTSAQSSDADSTVSDTDFSEAETSEADDSVSEESNIGEHLQSVADIYAEGSYTLECTLTTSDSDEEVKITRVVRDEDMYLLEQGEGDKQKYGMLTLDGTSYQFDYLCGMYCTTDSPDNVDVIGTVVDMNLDRTYTHIDPADSEDYDVEEYTYTGDTYITILDFYFDKESGELVKYTTTYSLEGNDDLIATITIDRLDNEIDESVFNTDFTEELVSFDDMSEDQRLGFCQGVCGSLGISTDDMDSMDITTDDFKTIDYDTFFTLAYVFADED